MTRKVQFLLQAQQTKIIRMTSYYFQQYVDDERFLYTDTAVSIDPVVSYTYMYARVSPINLFV